MIGKTLSHYEICSKLGEGGMGTVYRAHDNSLGRDVALKVLSANLTADIEFNQRFEREVKSLAALRHPSIVTIHSFEKDAGVCFYTMELVEGRTLADQIPATGFPLDRLFQLIIPVIDAVSHAHTQGIIHRDLKPTNIMLDQDGTPKVLDFGLAKLGDAGPTTDAKTVHLDELQTAEGRILGTFAYMSPEQAEGKPTDHRSDIFSLGIILYEMATGQRPFTGDTPVSTISAIIKDAPTSITTLNQHLPRHLWRIVKKCLEKDPGRRYQSTRDLRNDLAELKHEIDSGELSAPPPTMTSGGTRWARTGPWVALAIVIVIAAILGYQALKRNGPPAEAGPVQLAGAVNLTRSGKVQAADLTPDGKFLVYSERVKDRSNLRVLQLSTSSDVEILPPGNDKISSVQIGPQGDHAYYLNDTRRAVYRIALLGGDPQLVSEDVDEYALAPDGRQLAIMRSAGAQVGLWLGDIERGQQEPLLDEMQIGFSAHLTWSYAGDCILFNALKEQSIAQVLMQLSIAERLVSPANTHVWGYVDALSRLRDGSGFMIAGPRNPGPATIQEPSELWLMPTLASEAIRLTYDPFDYAAIGSDGQGNRLTTLQKQFEQTVQVIALANPAQPRQVMHMSRAGRWWMPLTWTRDDRILYPALAGHEVHLWEVDSSGNNRRRITSGGTFNSSCSVSPDGLTLAYASNLDGSLKIYLVDREGGVPRRLTEGKEDEFFPDFSPDGQWVAYNSFTGKQASIRKTSIIDGQTVDIGENLDYMPSFSPDGLKISCLVLDTLTYEYRMCVVSVADGRVLQAFDQMPDSYAFTRWTPDGIGLVYVQRTGDVENLWLQPLAGGEPRQLTHLASGSIAGFDLSAHGDSVAVATMEEVSDVVMFEDYRAQIARGLRQKRPD